MYLVTGFVFIGQIGIRGADDMQLWVALSLLAIAGFIVWLVFFSGNGDFKTFLEDLKGPPKKVKKESFPVPVFDRSKIEVPLPPKPERKPLTYKRTADEIDLKLDTWAKDLRQSLREVRAESQWLVEKYKDVPLRRAKQTNQPVAQEKSAPAPLKRVGSSQGKKSESTKAQGNNKAKKGRGKAKSGKSLP